jgi:Cys-tRNA(Pro) deacylase
MNLDINLILQDPIHIKIQNYIDTFAMGLKVIEFNTSTKTSDLAAESLGVEVGQIAKTLVFLADQIPLLVVTCGDLRVDQKKLKLVTGARKLKFADPETVVNVTGYPVGGVCPLALATKVDIYLDKSLARFDVVYAAAGTPYSALPITLNQLQIVTQGIVADLC